MNFVQKIKILSLLGAGLGVGLLAGCSHKDPSYTAAPPAGPNAHPLTPVKRQYAHPKLPPLVDHSGKRTGGINI